MHTKPETLVEDECWEIQRLYAEYPAIASLTQLGTQQPSTNPFSSSPTIHTHPKYVADASTNVGDEVSDYLAVEFGHMCRAAR